MSKLKTNQLAHLQCCYGSNKFYRIPALFGLFQLKTSETSAIFVLRISRQPRLILIGVVYLCPMSIVYLFTYLFISYYFVSEQERRLSQMDRATAVADDFVGRRTSSRDKI